MTQALEAVDGVVDFDAVGVLPTNDEQLAVEYRHTVDGGVASRQDAQRAGAVYTIIANVTAIYTVSQKMFPPVNSL